MARFDRHSDRDFEANRILDMKAIHRILPAPRPRGVSAVDGDAMKGRGVFLRWTERRVEIVLCAGSVKSWGPGLVVDEDHVVPFAVPIVDLPIEDVDIEHAADILSLAANVEDRVILFGRQIRLDPRALLLAFEIEAQTGPDRAVGAVIMFTSVSLLPCGSRRRIESVP